ncbi:hypothetical protein AVEN_67619-1 [Araneus ventricosus]|uniref:Uncharacterized protein n=1 Tax=Araneus ventricosus TaxID=182803 RepID=A0A4Y2SU53_ARAVE|nr:hypothetical protein AVEN_67619-1 [Araneus ventricosus]
MVSNIDWRTPGIDMKSPIHDGSSLELEPSDSKANTLPLDHRDLMIRVQSGVTGGILFLSGCPDVSVAVPSSLGSKTGGIRFQNFTPLSSYKDLIHDKPCKCHTSSR